MTTTKKTFITITLMLVLVLVTLLTPVQTFAQMPDTDPLYPDHSNIYRVSRANGWSKTDEHTGTEFYQLISNDLYNYIDPFNTNRSLELLEQPQETFRFTFDASFANMEELYELTHVSIELEMTFAITNQDNTITRYKESWFAVEFYFEEINLSEVVLDLTQASPGGNSTHTSVTLIGDIIEDYKITTIIGFAAGTNKTDFEDFPLIMSPINNSNQNPFYNPYDRYESTEDYMKGYEDGRKQGIRDQVNQSESYEIGYDAGYKKALEEAARIETEQADTYTGVFGMITTSLFGTLTTVLGVEVLPNITIGMIILIPLIFGLIAFIVGGKKNG